MSSRPLHVGTEPLAADWRAIEEALDELAEVAKSPLSAAEFYRRLLDRIVPAAGLSGAAIWTSTRQGDLCLAYQVRLTPAPANESRDVIHAHESLASQVLAKAEPRAIPPGASELAGRSVDNPTDAWLTLYPFRATRQAAGVIEFIQRPGATATASRDSLQLLAALAELAEDFHRHRELDELRRHEQSWHEFEQFSERVHRSLDVSQTAFAIANEGRRVIGCDRVSVLICARSKCRAVAISGVDVLDSRAAIVRCLERLAARCAASGEPVWCYDGSAELPDEIERLLHEFLDVSHARMVSVVPLHEPMTEGDDMPPRVVAVLVAERFQAATSGEDFEARVSAVAPHCATALANALAHWRLPLSSLGRMIAKLLPARNARRLPKMAIALATTVTAVACLALIPADFDIESHGELQPERRRDVFASEDGVVSELLVDHGQMVRASQPLVILRKPELDLELRRVAGEMQTTEKKLAAIQAERLENAPLDPDARRNLHKLTADEEELKEQLKGLREQHQILVDQQRDLVVRSPTDGQALTWNIKQLLESRPVQRGQTLLTVGDLAGPWVLELRVPDDRAGHVMKARAELQPDLAVSFALSADPGKVYEGRVADVALATELDETTGPTVLATVDFDRRDVDGLRPGATVIGRINCGRRSLGYVWLHDLFEFAQSHWWW